MQLNLRTQILRDGRCPKGLLPQIRSCIPTSSLVLLVRPDVLLRDLDLQIGEVPVFLKHTAKLFSLVVGFVVGHDWASFPHPVHVLYCWWLGSVSWYA